jgi:putative transposase
MADENNTGATSEVLATNAPADVPVVKKQRAPRRSKAAMEAASASPATTTVKSPKARTKRGAKVEATSAAVETPAAAKVAIKGPRKAKAAGQSKAPATKSVAAADEMADLIQLEEENKRLRKALADKLRAENADLRKRLGA